jgi:hypothetical protein
MGSVGAAAKKHELVEMTEVEMSIRFRLTIAAIAVILVANSLLSFLALQYLGSVWMGEVQTRVRRNLNSARGPTIATRR